VKSDRVATVIAVEGRRWAVEHGSDRLLHHLIDIGVGQLSSREPRAAPPAAEG
jgi:hypothetical protein